MSGCCEGCFCCCSDAEMTVDEKYKKTLEEIEALKDHLGAVMYQLLMASTV